MSYAFNFDGHGVFTPSGKTTMTPQEAEAYNAALEANELSQWSQKPERWSVYVDKSETVKTWLGTPLGTILERNRYRGNIARNMTSIRFRGTNGAVYYGRFGSDWSQLCNVRKVKGT